MRIFLILIHDLYNFKQICYEQSKYKKIQQYRNEYEFKRVASECNKKMGDKNMYRSRIYVITNIKEKSQDKDEDTKKNLNKFIFRKLYIENYSVV